jgi:hypothetical protein
MKIGFAAWHRQELRGVVVISSFEHFLCFGENFFMAPFEVL